MIIEELRLYKMNGDFLCFELGDNTTQGRITKLSAHEQPEKWFEVEYDEGKRHATLTGFNGTVVIYGPEVI